MDSLCSLKENPDSSIETQEPELPIAIQQRITDRGMLVRILGYRAEKEVM